LGFALLHLYPLSIASHLYPARSMTLVRQAWNSGVP
jgi:hypothetical protein